MNTLSADLRRAREARHLTLSDVAESTLINIRFLEAIESGDYSVMPETYMRAFIREYAVTVGLDPVDMMRRYDQLKNDRPGAPEKLASVPSPEKRSPISEPAKNDHGSAPEKRAPASAPQKQTPAPEKRAVVLAPEKQTSAPTPPKQPPPVRTPPRPQASPQRPPSTEASEPINPGTAKLAIVAMVIFVVVIVVWNLTREGTSEVTREIPFQDVVKQHEGSRGVAAADSIKKPISAQKADSLTLSARALDTVWVQIVIDNLAPKDYIFSPNRRISWKASKRFSLTVGNAGAVEFTLNTKLLGPIGKPGKVVRNFELSHQTLAKQ